MSADVSQTVQDWQTSVFNRKNRDQHHKFLKLSTAASLLMGIAMDMYGAITKSGKSPQYTLVIADWFTTFCRAVQL